ncbi:MAG TPA: hypothetical protein VKA91_08545 [Nitrososphaeraceae archaeon]|nr:hypothetical protein [Nitrososphaeraceae archaeon]
MTTECLGVSLGVLGGTLGLLGVLWYSGRRRRREGDNKDKNLIRKKRSNREILNEHTLTN